MKKLDIKNIQNISPDDLPEGCLIPEPGTSEIYKTGSWRTFRPVIDFEKCIQCLYCFIYCPDSSILTEEGKVTGVDYEHCKGCGICAAECPKSAITMIEEYKED